ncbi:MAG: nuclear transport factor 2 family protein [Pyrinomonadaceae bacterium]
MKKILTLTAAFFVLSLVADVARGQAKEETPLPEFYGLYLVVDGKLCGLDVEANVCTLGSVEVKVGSRTGVGDALDGRALSTSVPVRATELKRGVRFLSYRENPTAYLGALRLVPMMYVRNIAVDTGWPKNVKRSGVENAWDTGNPSEMGGEWNKLNELAQPIRLLIKPLKENKVLGVPSREMTPGLYRLSFGEQVIGNEPRMYFWVGKAAEAESLKCVDASYKYAMMMSEGKFTPCSGAGASDSTAGSGDGAASAPVNGPENGSAAGPAAGPTAAEVIEVLKRATEAGLNGDKAAVEAMLDESFTYTNLGNRKTWDRATFLSKVKRDKSIKSYQCGEYDVNFEGEVAVAKSVCEFHVQNFLISMNVKQRFVDRLVKKDGGWKFLSEEMIVLPNQQRNRR